MEEFEDLDEIIARYIQPMAALARDIINHKYYVEAEGGKHEVMQGIVLEEKRKNPSKYVDGDNVFCGLHFATSNLTLTPHLVCFRIPYFFTASKKYPGKFLLSYMPRSTCKHEFITVTPDGIRYRSNNFHSLNHLIPWFKEHFMDALPGMNVMLPECVRKQKFSW